VALALAAKYNLDRYEKNTIFFGIVVGVNRRQMRFMTDSFLQMIDFELYISEEEFEGAFGLIKTMIA
jgi:hypothetical protein